MEEIAYSAEFRALEHQGSIYIIGSNQAASVWIEVGSFPFLVKGTLGDIPCFLLPEPLPNDVLIPLMDEIRTAFHHATGRYYLPFGVLSVGQEFETMVKFTYQGTWIKTSATEATTTCESGWASDFQGKEVVLTV